MTMNATERRAATFGSMPPAGQVAAMTAILSEAGWPPDDDGRVLAVYWDAGLERPRVDWDDRTVPDEVVWKAYYVAGIVDRCFDCWLEHVDVCDHEVEL